MGVRIETSADVSPRATIDDASSVWHLAQIRKDAAAVAVPTGFHLETGLELAAAGVHTLVEKRLAADPNEAEKRVDAFGGAGISAVGDATMPEFRSTTTGDRR